jgi:hypothetical protein
MHQYLVHNRRYFAYIEDALGLINILGIVITAFGEITGNNILGNCTFGEVLFMQSSGNNILGNCTFAMVLLQVQQEITL